ncbi:hypothetical protein [Pedobacter cryoconitis]|uniref:Uncharacterized protein n=1 Tax=Pedobacter cryoconitis TaxID=188932 RepID=A0A7X0MLQ8_9SPHI|nr:hypothetical protein [Pedobacter cryoconitis]MBB6501663.1 hypothetical protein [Pedobacter cryoconitis]
MANAWYTYNGTGDPTLASSYSKLTGKPICLSGTVVCAIYAPAGGLFPFSPLSANILCYIDDGLSTLVPQPQLPAGTKYFVYMRQP